MDLNELEIVLASSSPSRKLLFERAGISFTVKVSGVDETVPDGYTPAQTVETLAVRKAEAVAPECTGKAVIAADSVVSIDGLILGKPESPEQAENMLRRLSGKTHQIYTGVCILANGKREVFSQTTDVTFYPLTDAEITEYVSGGESMGKAGSYGIEGKGVMLIRSIRGDYSNVVGIPVAETFRRLKKMFE